MHKSFYLLILIALFTFSGCIHSVKNKFNHLFFSSHEIKQGPPITIWIHGTRQFFSKYFFHNFFHCHPGINPACTFEEKYHLRDVAKKLAEADSERFSFDTFYFYGWSGKLSFEARHKAAQDLYDDLTEIIDQFKKTYNHDPFIRLITHSHGGNVALHLAEVKNETCNFEINELIMLAVPVQQRTLELIKDSLFKKIYSIYSTLDTIQIIDPQGFHHWYRHKTGQYKQRVESPFFSERLFPEQDNLLQIKLKMNRRGIGHVEFLMNHFIKNIPVILDRADAWHTKTKQTKVFVKLKT